MVAIIVGLMLAGSGAGTVSACPTCKVALANHDQNQGDYKTGYFWSILFMLSMPFATIGTFSGYMYWLVRRANAADAKAGVSHVAQSATTTQ